VAGEKVPFGLCSRGTAVLKVTKMNKRILFPLLACEGEKKTLWDMGDLQRKPKICFKRNIRPSSLSDSLHPDEY